MKKLVIAEKPSVAGDLARVLGKVPQKGEFYENEEWVIGSALGHLVELLLPQEIDEAYKKWSLDNLPILPDRFRTKPVAKTKDRLRELKKAIQREDVGEVINACDAGREGELIFTHILEQAKTDKPVRRLWMLSMTPGGIREAFEHLRDAEEMRPLEDAARSRQEADWLIGMNASRGATATFGRRGGNAANVGRVQTPTLAMVCEREEEIRNFVPQSYWQIAATFELETGTYEGLYQRPDFRKDETRPHDRANRVWDQAEAERILAEAEAAAPAQVTEKKKRTRQSSPRLYDLTSLQREANSRFGFSARNTLSIAQALYEKHKMLTYPRTDSRALPEDYPETVRKALANLPGAYQAHARRVLDHGWINPKDRRVFNNQQVSDHFAIIPTDATAKKLSEPEQKIYDMVVRRTLAIFHPPAEYDVTTRTSLLGEHAFLTEGKVLAVPGWLEVYEREQTGADTLPPLPENEAPPVPAELASIELREDATRPPPRYTESTLLSAMENAGKQVEDEELASAMRERGLGTPATRASILENLVYHKYLEREGKELLPTPKGEALVQFLRAYGIEMLTSPALTGEWEYQLKQMEEGELERPVFMNRIREATRNITDRFRSPPPAETSALHSFTDGQPLLRNYKAYYSQDTYHVKGRDIPMVQVNRVIGNRPLEEEEIAELLEKKEIGPLSGFRSQRGKPFEAKVVLAQKDNGTWRAELDFGQGRDGEEGGGSIDVSEAPVIGTCPLCGEPVHEVPNAYLCAARARDRSHCEFQISKNILGREITPDTVRQLLENRRTELLKGFRSKKNNRAFDAFLTLKEGGKLGFEFPERPKKAAKKTAKKATKKTAKKAARKRT